jgi:hypothetical protein
MIKRNSFSPTSRVSKDTAKIMTPKNQSSYHSLEQSRRIIKTNLDAIIEMTKVYSGKISQEKAKGIGSTRIPDSYSPEIQPSKKKAKRLSMPKREVNNSNRIKPIKHVGVQGKSFRHDEPVKNKNMGSKFYDSRSTRNSPYLSML